MVTNKHKTPWQYPLFSLRHDLLSRTDHRVVVKRAAGFLALLHGTWRGPHHLTPGTDPTHGLWFWTGAPSSEQGLVLCSNRRVAEQRLENLSCIMATIVYMKREVAQPIERKDE